MTNKTDMGGPAFPHDARTWTDHGKGGLQFEHTQPPHDGMALWDYYAAAALNGILSGPCSRDGVPAKEWFDAPEFAGKLADAMLAERTKRAHNE